MSLLTWAKRVQQLQHQLQEPMPDAPQLAGAWWQALACPHRWRIQPWAPPGAQLPKRLYAALAQLL